mmetsp:Transcript_7309/g.18391  ORF Transcript_7309/g.18391 Transcript_7309/m.18391 type:complete len:345 (-) Transcript_7309:53-1087(-)
MSFSPSASFASPAPGPDEQVAATGSVRRSSLVGDRDGSSWGFNGWGDDDKIQSCPRCDAQFSYLFRRHHCKNCGGLVCDNCSKGRARLPNNPVAGKARVCDQCVVDFSEDHVTSVREELAMKQQIIDQIKRALGQKHEEGEANKVVILELIAEAAGEDSRLQAYLADSEGDEHSFVKLRDLIDEQWTNLLSSLDRASAKSAAFEVKCQEARATVAKNQAEEEELLAKKAALDVRVDEMEVAAAEREELQREADELRESVAQARKQVQELEMERRDRLERQAQRQRRLGLSFGTRGVAARQASPAESPQLGRAPITISTGRQDPLLQRRAPGRLEECRRSVCAVM